MKRHGQYWLLLTAVLALSVPTVCLGAEGAEATVSGNVEVGVSAVGESDDLKRANEYSIYREDQGAQAYGKMALDAEKDGVFVGVDAEFQGGTDDDNDQTQKYDLDVKRVLRYQGDFSSFSHWTDHDRLDYLDATMKGSNTNNTNFPLDGPTKAKQKQPAIAGDDLTPGEDFMIIRREWKNEADLALPQLPGVTFHAGYRTEEREGTEQAIGMSKCAACHVVGESKDIDERTSDITAGFTGKFGLLTVDYEYLDRKFEERAGSPLFRYDVANPPDLPYSPGKFDQRLLYDYPDELAYNETPDSKKTAHSLKARVDLPRETVVVGSFVNSEVTSAKAGDATVSIDRDELTTELTSFGGKVKTRLGKNMTLSLSGSSREVEGDSYVVSLTGVDGTTYSDPYESAESRDETSLKADFVYRLARRSTLRLGVEYEETDREEAELGETETTTYKAAYSGRLAKSLSLRANYSYQDIEEPFRNHNAANVPLTTLGVDWDASDGLQYGVAFYDRRQDDLTNQPEEVNEAKVSTTWSPSSQFSTTLYARYRQEENDKVNEAYERKILSPGASMWYATQGGLNLTMAYNFNKDETENKMCVGWYHG